MTAMAAEARLPTPSPEESIFQLYQSASILGPSDFPGRALEVCRQQLSFDAAFWCLHHLESPTSALVAYSGISAQAAELLESRCVRHLEAFAGAAAKNRGVMVPIEPGDLSKDIATALGNRAGMGHALVGSGVLPVAPLRWLLLLLRTPAPKSTTANGAETLGQIATHVGGAATLALTGLVMRDRILRQMDRESRGKSGVSDRSGFLLACDDEFSETIAMGFPQWTGGRLPFDIPEALLLEGGEFWMNNLRIRVEPRQRLLVIHVRKTMPIDMLTTREREIVRYVVSGLSLKSTARKLGISPSTVANHTAHVYDKLGIQGRDRLVELVKQATRGKKRL